MGFQLGYILGLAAYGALKFGVKRALGLYGARASQTQPEAQAFWRRVPPRQIELGNVGFLG